MSAQHAFTLADRHALAWAFAAAASPRMSKRTRTWLWVQIGAGDYDAAIIATLNWHTATSTPLPDHCREDLLRYHNFDAKPHAVAVLALALCAPQ